jgi:hypothetical protein
LKGHLLALRAPSEASRLCMIDLTIELEKLAFSFSSRGNGILEFIEGRECTCFDLAFFQAPSASPPRWPARQDTTCAEECNIVRCANYQQRSSCQPLGEGIS